MDLPHEELNPEQKVLRIASNHRYGAYTLFGTKKHFKALKGEKKAIELLRETLLKYYIGLSSLLQRESQTFIVDDLLSNENALNVALIHFNNHPDHTFVIDATPDAHGRIESPDIERIIHLKNLAITDIHKRVTQIGDHFLEDITLDDQVILTSIDLSPLRNVNRIGNDFLSHCSRLTSVDLFPLQNVAHIGNNFLSSCSNLKSLDLTLLLNVSHVGDGFLTHCLSLPSIDLSALQNLTHIGDNFLNECSKLTSLDLSPLQKVTHIGDRFLSGCSKLTSLDLSPLQNVTHIGDRFLNRCSSLTSLDLSALQNVTHIGDRFLLGINTSEISIIDPHAMMRRNDR
jgi:hypothetical protein